MLQAIRDRATGIFAWVIVIGISLTLGLFGLSSYMTPDSELEVASVNGEDISTRYFNNQYQQRRDEIRENLARQFPGAQPDENMVKQTLVERLVGREVLLQYAMEQGMDTSRSRIDSAIRQEPAFRVDGAYSPQRFQDVLAARAMTPAGLQASLRRDFLIGQFQQAISGSALTLPTAARRYSDLITQTRNVSLLRLPLSGAMQIDQVTDEEIAAYYENSSDEFLVPDEVRLSYLELDEAALRESIELEEREIKARYDDNLNDYVKTPARRTASHIFFQVDSQSDAQSQAAIESRARTVFERLNGGEDFATLAAEFSEDQASAASGGDLGPIEEDLMDPEFVAALNPLSVGQISAPVRTDVGWHIIKLTAVSEATYKTFDEARPQIERALKAELAQKRYIELKKDLADLTYSDDDSLEPASDALSLPVQETAFFSSLGLSDGLASQPEIIEAAFSSGVLVERQNSALIELEGPRAVVIRVLEHRPAATKPLEQVAEQIRVRIASDKAADVLAQQADDMVAALGSGKTLSEVATEAGLTVRELPKLTRTSFTVDPLVLREAFRMPRPTGEGDSAKPSLRSVASASGDRVILQLNSVGSGDGNEQAAQIISQQVPLLRGVELTDAFLKQIRDEADVEIYQRNFLEN